MSPTKATTNDDAAKKQHVLPADFDEFVTTTASGLGDGWTVDPDDKPHPGLSAYLIHSDGRRIGLRHIWRGAAVQTWALDVPPRTFDNEADAEAHAWSVKQLTAGVRYNVGVCFTNNPPATTTARNIRTRLLPAFDGERPPLRAFPKKPSRRTSATEKNAAPTDGPMNSTASRANQSNLEEPITNVPLRAKKTQPTTGKPEPAKKPAAPRPRRAATTGTHPTKTKAATRQKPQPPSETRAAN